MGSIFSPWKFMPHTQIFCLLQHICNRQTRSNVSGSRRQICDFKRILFVPVLSHTRGTASRHDEKFLCATFAFMPEPCQHQGQPGIKPFHRRCKVEKWHNGLYDSAFIYKYRHFIKLWSNQFLFLKQKTAVREANGVKKQFITD